MLRLPISAKARRPFSEAIVMLLLCLSVTLAPTVNLAAERALPKSAPARATTVQEGTPPTFTIMPSSGVQGRNYEVVLTANQCPQGDPKVSLKDYEFYAPQGSGVRVSDVQFRSDCQLTARLTLADDAQIGETALWLKPTESARNRDDKLRVQLVKFTVNTITAGPIPPGLNNEGQVDVMWDVLPDSVVKDNFGGKIANEYYAIEVVIGNDSGFDLQIASVGFTGGNVEGSSEPLFNNRIPSTGFRLTRGSLQRRQQLSPRNLLINSLKVFGPFLTGFIPYFHNIGHRTNFSEAINIISNPLEKGLEFVVPDTTVDQLARLGDQAFRDDITTRTVIPNNTQSRILTFVPKDLIYPPTGKNALTRSRQYNYSKPRAEAPGTMRKAASGGSNGSSGRGDTYNPRNNPQEVMRKLGQLVLVGDQIAHVNRIRVVNSEPSQGATDFSISGRILDRCRIGVAGVTVKLSGGADFTTRTVTTGSDGSYLFANVPGGRNYTVVPESDKATFSPDSGGLENVPLNSSQTNVSFTADLKTFVITGKITKEGTSEGVDGIEMKLSEQDTQTVTTANGGVYTFTVTDKPVTGNFVITPQANDKFSGFKPSSRAWNCSHRDVDFTATPKK